MDFCILVTILLIFILNERVSSENEYNYTFAENFLFGAGTSAYQSEGAWNVDGKGPSVWDHIVHINASVIKNDDNGDDAALSYYLYQEDSQIVKDMGMTHYRFSISWTRIMSTGLPNNINQKGIDHYNKVIDDLLDKGILPMVTMYHFDMPQYLQNLGGWTNPIIIQAFREYSRVLYTYFGDRVKYWMTINEPSIECMEYEGPEFLSPFNFTAPGVGCYQAQRNMLLAHAEAYHLYDQEFRLIQQGYVSIVLQLFWHVPLDPYSFEDQEATYRIINFSLRWFLQPIFGETGDHPEIMKERIAAESYKEGFPWSRLPEFSFEEVALIRGSADFIALNHYSTTTVEASYDLPSPSFQRDIGAHERAITWLPSSPQFPILTIAPQGLRRMLNFVRDNYGDKKIFIVENGFPDAGGLNDELRQQYLGTYLTELWKAIYVDGINVRGYTVWSLIDNLEWNQGYGVTFGLYSVNFNDSARTRIPKDSAKLLKKIIRTRKIPKKYIELTDKFDLDARPPLDNVL